MCGIVGAVGWPFGTELYSTFYVLQYLNQLRGEDSMGLMTTEVTGTHNEKIVSTRVHKSLGSVQDYLKSPEAKQFINEDDLYRRVLIGHCRAATTGAVSLENAHPFRHKHIVAVHNGTSKTEPYVTHEGFGTDSENLTKDIHDIGWSYLFHIVKDDPYALVWIDEKDASLNMARSSGRPLYIATFGFDRMFFASDPHMLQFAMSYTGVKYQKIFNLKPDTHFRWDLKNNQDICKSVMVVPPYSKEVEKKQ